MVDTFSQAMISYAWKDHALVRPLVDSLIKMKFRVWIDVNNMGDQINEAMIDGIRGSAVVIPFISDSYVSSHNCKLEIKFANDIRKPILPVRLACSEAVLYSTAAFVTAGQLYIDLQSGVTQTSHRTVADRLAKLLSSVAPDLHPHYLQPMQQQQQQLVKVEETATAAGHLRWERANALLNLFDDHHREGKARMSEFLCSDSDARHCLTTFATAATETRQRLRAVRKLRTLERLARLSHYATAAMSSKSDKIPTPPSPVTVLCYGSATTLTLQFSAPMFTAWKLCAVLEQRRRFRAVTASDRCRPYLIAYPGMPRVSHLCHKCGGVVVICPIMEDDPTAREHIAESVLTHVERLNQLITRSKTASKLVAVLSTTLPEEDLTWVSKSGVSVDKEYVARYRRTSSRLHQFSTAQGGCNLAKILVAYIAGDHALTRVDPSDFGIWELAVLSAEPVVPYVQWAEGFARYRDGIEIDHSMTMARWDSLMRARQNCEARLSPLKMWSLFDQVVMGDKVEIGSDELSYYNVGKMAIIDDLGPKSVADKWLENEHVEVSVDAASGDLKFGGMNTESFAKLLGVEYKNPKGPRRAEESRIIVERMRECFLDTIGIETTCIALMESWQISRLASGTLAVKRVKNQWMRKIMRAVGVRNAVALLLGPLAAAAAPTP
ncbi:TIR domain-containing protein [Zopfochytrium polystomum]|nr:TIR domain-containing protein [Zopfochytrium polystomum]